LNSALNISTDDGDWSLYEGAAAATSNLTIGSTGFLTIDSNSSGDSALAISGALVNDTTIQLIPKGYDATLSVAGTTTNVGSIYVGNDSETLAGAFTGIGAFYVGGSTLTFDSSVSSGQTVQFGGAETLALASAISNSFSGTLDLFGAGDAIDAQAFAYASTSYNFLENTGGTGGTLTLTDGSLVDNIFLAGFEQRLSEGHGQQHGHAHQARLIVRPRGPSCPAAVARGRRTG
jgi:hypothetical protein